MGGGGQIQPKSLRLFRLNFRLESVASLLLFKWPIPFQSGITRLLADRRQVRAPNSQHRNSLKKSASANSYLVMPSCYYFYKAMQKAHHEIAGSSTQKACVEQPAPQLAEEERFSELLSRHALINFST
ncbi:MAG: hypothetical protein ABS948_16100 [Solibacillus sp.]